MKKFSLQKTTALSLRWKQPVQWTHFINKTTLKQNKKAIILAGLITGNPCLLGILKCCVSFPSLFFVSYYCPSVCVCVCVCVCVYAHTCMLGFLWINKIGLYICALLFSMSSRFDFTTWYWLIYPENLYIKHLSWPEQFSSKNHTPLILRVRLHYVWGDVIRMA